MVRAKPAQNKFCYSASEPSFEFSQSWGSSFRSSETSFALGLRRTDFGEPLGLSSGRRLSRTVLLLRQQAEFSRSVVVREPMTPTHSNAVPSRYRDAFAKAAQEWQKSDPSVQAQRGGCPLEFVESSTSRVTERRLSSHRRIEIKRRVTVTFYGTAYIVEHPTARVWVQETGGVPSYGLQTFFLHYLLTADGRPLTGEWVSFRELPDGMFYQQAFGQRSLVPLEGKFGHDRAAFERAATALGGEKLDLADSSFRFDALPRVPLAALLWTGDEEFPPAVQILFDASAGGYLPTEDLAMVGGMLSGSLLRHEDKP